MVFLSLDKLNVRLSTSLLYQFARCVRNLLLLILRSKSDYYDSTFFKARNVRGVSLYEPRPAAIVGGVRGPRGRGGA